MGRCRYIMAEFLDVTTDAFYDLIPHTGAIEDYNNDGRIGVTDIIIYIFLLIIVAALVQ